MRWFQVDDEHVLAFVEAVDRTYLDTVHVSTLHLIQFLVDDVRHLSVLLEDWPDFRAIEWWTH